MVMGEQERAETRSSTWWRRRRVLAVGTSRWWTRRLLSAFLGAAGLFVIAVVIALVLNLTLMGTQPQYAWDERLMRRSGLLGADVLVLWTLLLLAWAAIGRWWWTTGVVLALVPLILTAALRKLDERQEPLYPADLAFLSEPGFLFSMVPPVLAVLVLLLVVVIVAAVGGGGEWLTGRRGRPRTRGRELVTVVVVRALVLVVTGLMVLQLGRFNQDGNAWRALYEERGAQWRPWSQQENYLSNSVVGGFLYNMPTAAMERPAGYSEAGMEELAARWQTAADGLNVDRTGSFEDTNVVVVLSESFSDPTALEGLDIPEDPIPLTRETMAGTTSGTMLATGIGGGTANAEFEVLTGEHLGLFAPQMVVPYQMLVPNFATYPSLVGTLRTEGHRAVAVHPYLAGMYKRPSVYDTFGFDAFVTEDDMRFTDRTEENPYIDDTAAFDEVLAQIEDSDAPLVTNLVTMQNHAQYGNKYDDVPQVGTADGISLGPSFTLALGDYVRGISDTDAALRDFLDALEESDEDTVVLFYGDHLPGFYGEGFRGLNGDIAMHSTPFFAWSNRGNVPLDAGVSSSALLMPYLYDVADAPLPPYLALLRTFHERVGSVFHGQIVTPDGDVVAEEDLDDEQQRLLQDLRLVQYDVAVGERYVTDEIWPGSTGQRG
ncbi:phosphoglycerol transferase MdoB-like AlkP superfamily enzyme [Nocardioides zeae]|uniref:Phosphoglycerol transferase MdoB-like AlkP superfamily enzyme n=2 Tax=Nocardioides zeae TaxID=1457234 RepID=A0AAJ1U0N3_9ACTN|nr:phosphoglycerol transferase MdoB-like AlkP superfamily enzyme [Nocardioides zeae]